MARKAAKKTAESTGTTVENGTTTVQEGTTPKKARKPSGPRNASIKADVFIDALIAACAIVANGVCTVTGPQLAKQLGMNQASFDQRMNALRKDYEVMTQRPNEEPYKAVYAYTHNADGTVKPFPYRLRDARHDRVGSGKGAKNQNALLAALTRAG